jgi:hypothetical protein
MKLFGRSNKSTFSVPLRSVLLYAMSIDTAFPIMTSDRGDIKICSSCSLFDSLQKKFETKHSLCMICARLDIRTNQRHTANTNGYAQSMDNLPVATLVSEETMPPSTAPLSPSAGGGDRLLLVDNEPTVSRFPMMMQTCPNCSRESRTRVTTAPSWKTWAASGCLFFAFWPLCWLPLVVDSCKTTEHFCVSCGAKVAKVEAFDDCCVEHRG